MSTKKEKQKVITHLYNVEVEVPVTQEITAYCNPTDNISAFADFTDLEEANNFAQNYELDVVDIENHQSDLLDAVEVTVEKDETEKNVHTITKTSVDDLNDQEIKQFLIKNDDYELAYQKILTTLNDVSITTQEKRKVFVLKNVNAEMQKASA